MGKGCQASYRVPVTGLVWAANCNFCLTILSIPGKCFEGYSLGVTNTFGRGLYFIVLCMCSSYHFCLACYKHKSDIGVAFLVSWV